MNTHLIDFDVQYEGSISIFRPKTPRARDWWDANVEAGQSWGGGYVVEHRFVDDIAAGILADGMNLREV